MIRRGFLPLMLLLSAFETPAQEAPFAEVSVTPEQVSVGEPVTLRVSVFVPTWFAKPPTFPSFEIPNAVTRLPPDSSRPATKRVGRDTWSGVTRSYQVYPLMGARFVLESETIDVLYANPGSDPVAAQVDTGDIVITAVVPAGAESLDPYVAGSRFEITRSIEGDTAALTVGDAVVVTYTAELEGLPAIFLPEIVQPGETAGLATYPEQPVVEEGPPARRTEKVTYIFNAGGDFEIPAVDIEWWNRNTSQIESASVPSLSLAVAGPTLQADAPAEPIASVNWPLLLAVVAAIGLLLWRLRGSAAELRSKAEERERKRRASEHYAWKKTQKVLAGGDAHRAHDEIVRWLDRLEPGLDSRTFAARYGDEKLESAIAGMQRALYSDSGETPDLKRIAVGLSAARAQCLNERNDAQQAVLPPLNP